MSSQSFLLSQSPAVLDAQLGVTRRTMGPDLYTDLDRDFAGFAGCTLVAQYSFESDWSSWECHPSGDELVYLIAGDVEFVLRMPGGDQHVIVDEPGRYVIVPRGIWHTARPRAPTTMLFITPGQGTQNAAQPPEAPGD